MPARAAALALALAVVAVGCASSSGEPSGGPGVAEGDGVRELPSRLHVSNRNWLDMRVYALRGSERISLLRVTSMRTDSVALPRTLLAGGGFRLLADPVGADPYRSGTVYLRPGQTVWWRLENVLTQSSLWVH